ncbi:MAG: class I SAM-dependent methyltransferase [Roseiflexaceae bacterium]
MSNIADQTYLREQYKNASNLNDRIQLHVRFSTNPYDFHLWVFDQLKLGADSRVLELGCGPGSLWRPNLARIPAGWQITLTDFSAGMLAEARANLAGAHPFAFEQADAQMIPFADTEFDAVIANHMLYHVPDRAKAFAEIRRVLRPAGRFYAATNGENHLREIHELVHQFDSTTDLWNRMTFRLENGADELSHFFSHVLLHRYESALIVTEAEPLVAFVASMIGDELAGARRAAFTQFVEEQIAADGAIHVTKATGLFEAY